MPEILIICGKRRMSPMWHRQFYDACRALHVRTRWRNRQNEPKLKGRNENCLLDRQPLDTWVGWIGKVPNDVANGTKLTEGVGVVVKSGFAVREQLRENCPTLAGTILKKNWIWLICIRPKGTSILSTANFVKDKKYWAVIATSWSERE